MKKFVLLMSLVIVQGSSLFEQELENYNGLENEGSNALAVSMCIAPLTGEVSDLKSRYNRNAIGTSPIRDKLKRFFTFLDLLLPPLGTAHMLQYLNHGNSGNYNTKFKVVHPTDSAGQLEDLFLAIHKIPEEIAHEAAHFLPEIMSLSKGLGGLVKCHGYQCSVVFQKLGLNMSAGYDAEAIAIFLYVEILGFTIVNEKISTKYFKYCEPIQLPIKKVKLCVEASNIELSTETACLNFGFSILSYSHTFPDVCLFGSRTES